MKLSEIEEYRRYMMSRVEGDLDAAERHLVLCLDSPAISEDPQLRSFILRRIAELRIEVGDRQGAKQKLQEAEDTAPGSFEVTYYVAAAYLTELGDIETALRKSEEARALVSSDRTLSGSERRAWILRATALSGRCLSETDQLEGASECLRKLAGDREEVVVEHALELCEKLRSSSQYRGEARSYMMRILGYLDRERDRERDPASEDLRRRVADLLGIHEE